jgi:hypothetical protein
MQEVIRCIFGRLADIDVTAIASEQVGFASETSSLLPPFLVLDMMMILLAVLM